MKKSLHSPSPFTPTPLAFLGAMPAPEQAMSLPRPAVLIDCGQNPTFASPNRPRPAEMPWALGQAPEMLAHFPWSYQKASAACGTTFLANLKLVTKKLCPPTSP